MLKDTSMELTVVFVPIKRNNCALMIRLTITNKELSSDQRQTVKQSV